MIRCLETARCIFKGLEITVFFLAEQSSLLAVIRFASVSISEINPAIFNM